MWNPSVLNVYRHFFAARLDVYSKWTGDGWRPVRSEMSEDVLGAALSKQGPSVSGYMIAADSTTHVAAIDFDLEDGLALGKRLMKHMAAQGATAYVEPSRRGCHLWLVIDMPLPARVVRAALQYWLSGADMPRDPENPNRVHPKIELRPATDQIDHDGLGHCLRMPMMPHPMTGQRGLLEGPSGPLGNKLAEVLLEIEMIPRDVVEEAAMRWVPVIDPKSIPSSYRNPKTPREDDGASASELLRQLWGSIDAAPGKVVSCPAKEFHSHGDVHKGCKVFPDDKRVMCHKPGCVLNNDGKGRGTWELRTMAPHGG